MGWEVNGTLVQQNVRQFLDQQWVDHRGGDGCVTEQVLFETLCVGDLREQIEQRFAVGKIEGHTRAYLTPNEHVLGGERDLLVPLADIRSHRSHDFLFGNVYLRAEVRHAEVAAASAARGHFDYAESGPLFRDQDAIPVPGMSSHHVLR